MSVPNTIRVVSLCGGLKCCPDLRICDDGSIVLTEGSWSLHLDSEQAAKLLEELLTERGPNA